MRKLMAFLVLVLLLMPMALADGMMIIQDQDMWGLLGEEQQLCAINYQNGFQDMILMVDTSEELKGDKAVWIFPVPAKPEKTAINIIKGFPYLTGRDLKEAADDSVSGIFTATRLTQIYTLPEILMMARIVRFGAVGMALEQRAGATDNGVIVHEKIEKMGLTTELVTAEDGKALSNYLLNRGLDLPGSSESVLNEYVGQEYSFVISWISDIEQFKAEQSERQFDYNRAARNQLGVSITFPTEKIYFPLKPTSVYGSERVPAVIYVMDYVTPELYPEIETDSEVTYFYQRYYAPSEELRDFFDGKETVLNLKYTKIKINPPSKFLVDDLWIKPTAPAKVRMMDFATSHAFVLGLAIFILCSCLASMFSGMVVFRKYEPSKGKFFLWGLLNFFSLIGFSIVTYLLLDKKFNHSKKIKWLKPLVISLVIGAVIPAIILVYGLWEILRHTYWSGYDLAFLFLSAAGVFFFVSLFMAPFVWGLFNNRKVMWFTVLFSVFFVVLTIFLQIVLGWII